MAVMLGDYEPLEWPADCQLGALERAEIDTQRRKLWRLGIRDPDATLRACELAAVVCLQRAVDRSGVK